MQIGMHDRMMYLNAWYFPAPPTPSIITSKLNAILSTCYTLTFKMTKQNKCNTDNTAVNKFRVIFSAIYGEIWLQYSSRASEEEAED